MRKKSTHKDKVITKNSIASRLDSMAQDLKALSEKILNNGEPRRPFHENEKELVRMSYLPIIMEMTQELKLFYLTGNVVAFEEAQDVLHDWMREISDL